MNTSPLVIGYWARRCGLELGNLIDCYDDANRRTISYALNGLEEQASFRSGWEEADKDISEEKFNELVKKLKEVGE